MCVRGSGRPTKTAIYWTFSYGHQRCVFLVLLILNRRPGCSAFCWMLAFSTTSSHQRASETTECPEGPLGREWFSLPHLNSNFSCLTSCLHIYMIVQRPLNRPLNPWNSMFDRHQAEITVMQFRGHSLPVHLSMSVSWDFYRVLFHQPNPPTQSLSITGHWDVSLPSGASHWNGMFGRVEGQNTTRVN